MRQRSMTPSAVIYVLILLVGAISACPGPVTQLCYCTELHNGVILDCSKTDGYKTMQILRENQAQLGLIQSLTMHESNLITIPKEFFSGLFIKKLDLSHNSMTSIDDNAFDGINAVLQELIVTHNNLSKIPSKALSNLPTILKFDISNNTINEISEPDVFPTLNKIYDINLGSNNISSIHTSTFQNIKNTLQAINLGHNRLTAVPSSAIRGLKQLQALHLHHNKIKQLEALNFLNLPVLNLLNLAGNQITELNRQAFLNVPSLRYLYLTDNNIIKLASHQFASFEQLEMLDLTHNKITEIPNECLAGLKQLRQVYMGNNQISKIGNNSFANSSIVILAFPSNNISYLPDGVLSGLPALQQVTFKDNQIASIHPNAFYNAPSLVMIDLSNNQLTELAPSTFLAQLNLLLIDLSGNKLAKTPYAAFNRRVGTVMLKENPLVCVEKIHMLQDGQGINIEDSDDIICGGKPKTTTTTTSEPPTTTTTLVQLPKLMPKKQPENEADVEPTIQPAQTSHIRAKPHSRFISKDGQIPRIIMPSSIAEKTRNSNSQLPDFIIDAPTVSQPAQNAVKPQFALKPDVLPTREEEQEMEREREQQQQQPQQQQQESSEDNESTQSITTTEESTTSTSTNAPRRYTDIADNPNLIHPFPVPFLKRGPSMNKATAIKSSTDATEVHTLPPSILIEPGSTPRFNTTYSDPERFEDFLLRTQPAKDVETTSAAQPNKAMFPTTIVLICIGTALIVMIAVIIGLCVSKHRQLQFENTYSDSSVARTNEYVAAQAHINSVYNTHNTRVGRFDDSPAWIYNPGANYCNYYK